MEIKHVPLKDIKPYERNNKKHPKHQIEKLAKQIESLGFDVPIVLDENNVIIKGHARFLSLKHLNKETAPCIIRTDLTENQKKAARIADNKLAEIAEIDLDNLKIEMEELKNIDFDVDLTGFDDWSMLNVFAKKEEIEFSVDEIEDKKPKKEKALILTVVFDNEEELEELFTELNERGFEVKR
jgi:ParB family chromosome partitioning protein